MTEFPVTDRYNKTAVRLQQRLSKSEPPFHHREPFCSTEMRHLDLRNRYYIPVTRASIVRRVNVYAIYSCLMRPVQELQGGEVIPLDEQMMWPVTSPHHCLDVRESWKDGLTVPLNTEKGVHRGDQLCSCLIGDDDASPARTRFTV